MRAIYSSLLYLLTPLVLLRLLWRGCRNPAYRQRWRERFGYPGFRVTAPVIWVHCVSVGETLAAVPLIRGLQQRYPQSSLLVTTTTPTGSAQVRHVFATQVLHSYLPYDLPGSVHRFLDYVRPRLVVILETELWPNLFAACRSRQIPLAIVNARMSPRSFRGYSRFRALVALTLQQVNVIAAQSERDADCFRQLGATSGVCVTGNIKFDMEEPEDLQGRARELRLSWDEGLAEPRLIWIAASTHDGEDEQILTAFQQVRERAPDTLLVLVPRHPERFNQVAALARDWCQQRGLHTIRRSDGRDCDAATAIVVGDTLGELRLFYAAADIAFVGGSLVPTGGHNILEPAQAGLPVISGPHTFNFQEAVDLLVAGDALVLVEDAQQLAAAVIQYINDADLRRAAGGRAKQIVAANRGALERTLAALLPLLSPEPVATEVDGRVVDKTGNRSIG